MPEDRRKPEAERAGAESTGADAEEVEDTGYDGGAPLTRPRTATSIAEIDSTISHPGSVRINVKGAFIVDQGATTPANGRGSPDHHQTQDIRLPNHHAVVSHIAVDVYMPYAHRQIMRSALTAKPVDWRLPS